MIFNKETKMDIPTAQAKYDEALAKYQNTHKTKDWEKLMEAQELLNQAMTEWFKQNP
tara:strand:+ start:227 stop:397 length:171 start_codon:yes stop_codon:yes gene_type:complete